MLRQLSTTLLLLLCLVAPSTAQDEDLSPELERQFLTDVRQLTFEGRRAGEGYFSRDGRKMVFQSEREAGNPFFQIYVMDMDTGDVTRVSPGHGKTTCAWIHPRGNRVLFASTHEDPQARQKQKDELELRATGKERRYSWDYDATYDLFVFDPANDEYTNVTQREGYDAEGSWSPDGKQIAFASNRWAYENELSESESERFQIDKSLFMDIYIMDTDGSNVRRLTTEPGYDGGPFFSPDGKRICWRRFNTEGVLAEIMSMNIDGTDKRQLTKMGAMSWAPFYHPSGDYLVFTTNRHGFGNFELYLIDAKGSAQPVRVTFTDGFDGLPAFTPDGSRLVWTTNRTASKQSQLFQAKWNDDRARELLAIGKGESQVAPADDLDPQQIAQRSAMETKDEYSPDDILRHVDYLCRPELGGRLTGSPGAGLATSYVAAYFDSLGLLPGGDDGGWFQQFDFTSGVSLGSDNKLSNATNAYSIDEQWRPLAFSATGEIAPSPVTFAGYGIVAPKTEDGEEYDSYVHLDVANSWVLVLRYLPEEITPERRQHLNRYSSLRHKVMVARDKGVRGVIVVSGPRTKVKHELVPLRFDGTLAGSSTPVISVTNQLAADWISGADKRLDQLQATLDTGKAVMGFSIPELEIGGRIDVKKAKSVGRNVIGYLSSGAATGQAVLVGAHLDHLGRGTGGSLARGDEVNQIHYGADDNASGVGALLEIAQQLSAAKREGRFAPQRDVIFAAWSGEELGLLGSSHFAKQKLAGTEHANPHQATNSLNLIACLNLDMVGRLEKRVVLQGIGSSSIWTSEIERRNVPVGLPLTLQNDSYVPTDASTFFMHGIPSLTAFTGSHNDYHTPRDTPDKLNYEGAAKIARLMGLITRSLALRDTAPDFIAQVKPDSDRPRAGLRAYLGTIPDYAESDLQGLKLSGVSKGAPAAEAGVRGGDVVVELAGKKIDNIYDYTYAIDALKIGDTVKIVVMRDGNRIESEITPASRE